MVETRMKKVVPHVKNRKSTDSNVERAEQVVKAVELRRMGKSFRDIGTELGVSYETVRAWIRKALNEYVSNSLEDYRTQAMSDVNDMIDRNMKLLKEEEDSDQRAKIESILIKAFDHRAKISGAYSPIEQKVTIQDQFSDDYNKLLAQQEESNIARLKNKENVKIEAQND